MAPSSGDIRALLIRGIPQPVAATLTVTRRRPQHMPLSVTVGADTAVLFTDPEQLTIRRAGQSLHLTRGGRDILRRSGRSIWLFEQNGSPLTVPLRHVSTGLSVGGALAFLVEQRNFSQSFPLYAVRPEDISEGRIASRPVWLVRLPPGASPVEPELPISFAVDQDYGVLLAVETTHERLTAQEITFPDSLPDPWWTGNSTSAIPRNAILPAAPDPADVPGYLPQLPPHSAAADSLRIFVSETSLEGDFPEYRVGDDLNMMLGFSLHSPPVAGLQSSHRVLVRNEGAPTGFADGPMWRLHLTGVGWTALTESPTPMKNTADLTGWFYYDGFGVDRVPYTSFRITAIYAVIRTAAAAPDPSREPVLQQLEDTHQAFHNQQWWMRDVILDVTLDDPLSTPPDQRFRPTSVSHDGDTLWLGDTSLPVVRCWDTTTGRYLGQTLVPTAVDDNGPSIGLRRDKHGSTIASARGHAWQLSPGVAVATAIPGWSLPVRRISVPPLPHPWQFEYDLGEGIYHIAAWTEEHRRGIARVRTGGEVDICEIDFSGSAVLSCLRIGAEYLLRTTSLEYRIDADFQLRSSRRTTAGEPNWTPHGALAYRMENRRLRFVDRETSDELPTLDVPEGHRACVVEAAASRIVVLIHRNGPDHPAGLGPVAVARLDAGDWDVLPLETTPEELFPANRGYLP